MPALMDDDAPLLRAQSQSTSTLSSTSSMRSRSWIDPQVRRRNTILRTLAFMSAIFSSLGAGSITVFSLYGHLFQSRLHLTQLEINGIASTMSISLYLPVPFFGYLCDRSGPSLPSLLSALLLGGGYGLAAGLYRKGEVASSMGEGPRNHGLVPYMMLAFFCIGIGTASMYMSAITTCAKNFGKGRYRGLMLVMPIASFGLSGMIFSQVGSRLLFERLEDGRKGDVNVFYFFLFLAILLAVAGLLGGLALRIVDEDELIDEAVEELERSGLLERSESFRHSRSDRATYGTIDGVADDDSPSNPNKTDDDEEDEDDDNAKVKKQWLLNAETRRFVTDSTMWYFTLGFWLLIGPGEAFINNLGTIIGTLQSADKRQITTAATHVSIVAATSTVARLLTGFLGDLLAPSPQSPHPQVGLSMTLPTLRQRLSVSRVTLIISAGVILSLGTIVQASGAVQGHADHFWVVSGLIGTGYGAIFSLMPMIVTVIWGVENFGTNFGIVAVTPALGSTLWGLIYSAVYQAGAVKSPSSPSTLGDDDVFCYGQQCYSSVFWGMTLSAWLGCLMIAWAWKGRDGWARRGVLI